LLLDRICIGLAWCPIILSLSIKYLLWRPFRKQWPVEIFNAGNQFRSSLSTHISNFDDIGQCWIFTAHFLNGRHNTAKIQHCSISTSWIDYRHRKISTGLHFQNGRHNAAKIQHCSISKVAFDLFFNVEFLPPIFYAVFWQPFSKWQTSRKWWPITMSNFMSLSLSI
jgi:hypothetical protein